MSYTARLAGGSGIERDLRYTELVSDPVLLEGSPSQSAAQRPTKCSIDSWRAWTLRGTVRFGCEYNHHWMFAGSTLRSARTLLDEHDYQIFLLNERGLCHSDVSRLGELFAYSTSELCQSQRSTDSMRLFCRIRCGANVVRACSVGASHSAVPKSARPPGPCAFGRGKPTGNRG